jgi:alkylation response protein AidB-like acyl-CoA dehydrogenase
VREWGIEQIVRDSRVSMIYEGTNEIQAIDLLVRKVLADGGAGLIKLMTSLVGNDMQGQQQPSSLEWQTKTLEDLTAQLVAQSATHRELPYWVADDYLRAVALTLLAWAWQQIGFALTADANSSEHARWQAPAAAVRHWVLPEFSMRVQIIRDRLI